MNDQVLRNLTGFPLWRQRAHKEEAMPNGAGEAARAQARHKLRLILMSRRYWFEHGSRDAARRVTQELFDLAFGPGELDVLR